MEIDNNIPQAELIHNVIRAEREIVAIASRLKEKCNTKTCPHCGHGALHQSTQAGIMRCGLCYSFASENYNFKMPVWARGKKQYFKRAFCLMFNVQEKEN